MAEVKYKGALTGHSGWVTSIATTYEISNLLVSASRDKTALVWELTPDNADSPGYARRCLRGHNEAINDCVISSDGTFGLTGSSDRTLRLWDLASGTSVRTFKGHTSDVNSVAFSSDNRQIVSGSRDKTIRLWNTLAECKFTIGGSGAPSGPQYGRNDSNSAESNPEGHSDWVSCVRFSPSAKTPLIVSSSWDRVVKVWNLNNCKLKTNLAGHSGCLFTITISPDGSLCASGGRDGTAMLWDVNDGKHLYSLDANSTISSMVFSPKNYWLCAATSKSIIIWDLENKAVLDELVSGGDKVNGKGQSTSWVKSLQWSADGNTLFAGSTDGNIYVYGVGRQ